MHVFPEHEWKPWKFQTTPQNYWVSAENVKSYMDWLGEELGYKSMDDWYKITQAGFLKNGGGALLHKYHELFYDRYIDPPRYGYSPSRIITTVFPQREWLLWKFDHQPQNIWDDMRMQVKYMEWLGGMCRALQECRLIDLIR